MQATMEGGRLMFARRHGRDYMMRSEKRPGYGGASGRGRPPKRRRRRGGFLYALGTALASVLLWPVGMVLLWRRRLRWQATTKLLFSIVTLFICVVGYGFALTVPTGNPTVTRVQDSVNDFLDHSVDYVSDGAEFVRVKAVEVYQSAADLSEAFGRACMANLADGIDSGVELASRARSSVSELFAPDPTDEPAASPTVSATGEPSPSADSEPSSSATAAATDAPSPSAAGEPNASSAPDAGELPLSVPDSTPDPASAMAIGDGLLTRSRDFIAASPSPSGEPEASDEPDDALEPEASDEPSDALEPEASDEPDDALEPEASDEPDDVLEPEASDEPENALEPEASDEPENALEPEASDEPENALEPEASDEPEASVSPAPSPESGEALEPKPAGEAVVYYNADGVNYHIRSSCVGMRSASAGTLADAVEQGLRRCRNCLTPDASILEEENVVWVDEANRFHLTDECAAFEGEWSLMTLEDALAEGCEACEACLADVYAAQRAAAAPTPEPTPSPTPAPTATPEPETVYPLRALKPAAEALVYHSSNGGWYHTIPNCSGMTGGDLYPLAECVEEGFQRCRRCEAPLPELLDEHCLWLDEDGLCHTSDECAEFSGDWTLIPRDEALEAGYAGCAACGADEYLIPGTVVDYPEWAPETK